MLGGKICGEVWGAFEGRTTRLSVYRSEVDCIHVTGIEVLRGVRRAMSVIGCMRVGGYARTQRTAEKGLGNS